MRPHKFSLRLGNNLSLKEDRLAATDGPDDGASERKPKIWAHFMPLEQVSCVEPIRTRHIEQHQIGIASDGEGTFPGNPKSCRRVRRNQGGDVLEAKAPSIEASLQQHLSL